MMKSKLKTPTQDIPMAIVKWPTPHEWRDALLSGDWDRQVGLLRSFTEESCACCLGVLASMAGCLWKEDGDWIERLSGDALNLTRQVRLQERGWNLIDAGTLNALPPWMTFTDMHALMELNDTWHEGTDWSKVDPAHDELDGMVNLLLDVDGVSDEILEVAVPRDGVIGYIDEVIIPRFEAEQAKG